MPDECSQQPSWVELSTSRTRMWQTVLQNQSSSPTPTAETQMGNQRKDPVHRTFCFPFRKQLDSWLTHHSEPGQLKTVLVRYKKKTTTKTKKQSSELGIQCSLMDCITANRKTLYNISHGLPALVQLVYIAQVLALPSNVLSSQQSLRCTLDSALLLPLN